MYLLVPSYLIVCAEVKNTRSRFSAGPPMNNLQTTNNKISVTSCCSARPLTAVQDLLLQYEHDPCSLPRAESDVLNMHMTLGRQPHFQYTSIYLRTG